MASCSDGGPVRNKENDLKKKKKKKNDELSGFSGFVNCYVLKGDDRTCWLISRQCCTTLDDGRMGR